MECNNTHCMWNAFGHCCPEDAAALVNARPNKLDCPSSLRKDFEEQLSMIASECRELIFQRNMKELIEIKKFIQSQRN